MPLKSPDDPRIINRIFISESGRFKQFPLKSSLISLTVSAMIIIAILISLGLYTPYILYRSYDAPSDDFVKEWFPNPVNLVSNHIKQIWLDNISAMINVLWADPLPAKEQIPSVNLWIPNNSLEILNHQIFRFSMKDDKKKLRVKGLYKGENGNLYPIRFGMRGARETHHMVWKPSLRIKFKKSNFPEEYRDHSLIVPKDGVGLRNWLSGYLSRRWGLLSSNEHFVKLFINNKYFGFYNRLYRLDESLFINAKRLPGPIFRLEHTDNRYLHRVWYHWDTSAAWQSIGISPKNGEIIIKRPIETAQNIQGWHQLRIENHKFKNLYSDLSNYIDEINEVIDQDSFAKYLALITHSGSSHVDDRHNNALWMDQGSGKMIPFLVDITGYDFPAAGGDSILSPIIKDQGAFVRAWLMHPMNFALYIDHLYTLINTFGSVEYLEKVIRSKWALIRPAAFSDVNISVQSNSYEGLQLVPVTSLNKNVEDLIKYIDNRNRSIHDQLSEDILSIVTSDKDRFEIFIQGFSGVVVQRKDSKSFKINGNNNITKEILYPSVGPLVNKLDSIAKSYAFYSFPGQPEDYLFNHRFTSRPLSFSPFPFKNQLSILRSIKGVNFLDLPKTKPKSTLLGPGEVFIHETREFEARHTVTIAKGTQIRLAPQVSLIFKGPLMIKGTKNQPVIIRPQNPKQPFGTISLLGKGARGSRIRHLDIEGGSIHRRHNLQFTGMFSVHDNPDIEIESSRFGPNFIGDDAVHIVRSQVIIKDSLFENAFMDALDLDLVNGKIINSDFINPGNDAVDISMGEVSINGGRFSGAKDKCISAGEGTRTHVRDVSFEFCQNGIAVKDTSHLVLENAVFRRCFIAWNSYKKKWRWKMGGTGIIKNSQFINSTEADIAGDKFSSVILSSPNPTNLKTKGDIVVTNTNPT